MRRSRHVIWAAVAVLLSLSALGCTGGRPGPSRADLQADTAASSTLESPASTNAGRDGGQPSEATAATTSAGASAGTTASPGGAGNRVPGAPVTPGNRNNQPQALGAPIKVPAFQQVGAPIGEVFGSIRDKFVAVCGGRLCVTLVIQPADADRESCGFSRTSPGAGTTVQRNTTVAVVCTPAPTETSETTRPDDTTPDDSQPPSSS